MYAFAVKLRLKLEGNVVGYIKALFSTKTAIPVHCSTIQKQKKTWETYVSWNRYTEKVGANSLQKASFKILNK